MEKMRKDGGKGKEEEGCREGGRSGGRGRERRPMLPPHTQY